MELTPKENEFIDEVCDLVDQNEDQIFDFIVSAIRLWESGEKLIEGLTEIKKKELKPNFKKFEQ